MMGDPAANYDPHDIEEYNPADLANLVRYCVQELMARRSYSLDLPGLFTGPGIYALFYDGDFPPYQHTLIRSPNADRPIYVGRARMTKSSGPRPLHNRLRQHANSIKTVPNLKIDDFVCRFLILHPLWVSTVEDLLIEHYSTVWNDVVEGFGVHDPGKERHTGEIPLWAILHPGRGHHQKMLDRGATARPVKDVIALIESDCAAHPVRITPISQEEGERLTRAAGADDELTDGRD